MSNSTHRLAFMLAVLTISAPATAQYGGQPEDMPATQQPKPSEAKEAPARKFNLSDKARVAIFELQKAVDSKDPTAITEKLGEARKVARKPDEKFLVAANEFKAAMNAGNLGEMQAGIEAMVASGSAQNTDVVPLYVNLGKRYFDAQQFDASAAVIEKMLALDASNPDGLKLLAATRERQGRKAEAIPLMRRAIAATRASGQTVAENEYKFALGIAHQAKMPIANELAREWVSAYPTTANWHAAMRVYRDVSNPQGAVYLDHMRLARAAGALNTAAEYYNFASALFEAGHQAEAKSVLAEAPTKGIATGTPEFRDLASRLTKVETRAAVDASARAALAGTAAQAAIDAGDAYFGLGAYADAAAAYKAALGKSGIDSNLANLRLGAALARSGDKAGAAAALGAVSGPLSDTAKYWLVWLGSRT